jgi:heme oxygenase
MTVISSEFAGGSHATADLSASPAEPAVSLSLRLRAETTQLHREIEGRLGFPQAMADLPSYRSCLVSYFRLYCPIEASLWRFADWAPIGIQSHERRQLPRLAKDLRALKVDRMLCAAAPREWLPPMPDFPSALGVFYVLEGSTLGGQVILRHLRAVLGDSIDGADAFFNGHGPRSGAMWNAARAAIDAYGEKHPDDCDRVIEGAASAFRAVGAWMVHDA